MIWISEQSFISACEHKWLMNTSQLWWDYDLTLCLHIVRSSILISRIMIIFFSKKLITEMKGRVIYRIIMSRKWGTIVLLILKWMIKMLLALKIDLLTLSSIACRYVMIRPFLDIHIKSDVFLIVDIFYEHDYCRVKCQVR